MNRFLPLGPFLCFLAVCGFAFVTNLRPVLAQSNPASFQSLDLAGQLPLHTFTTADGLPQNTIEAIAFDRQGYLWIGTQNGISRYNGRAWQNIPLAGATSGSLIHDILAASDGSMWFAKQDGISRFRNGTWQHFDQQTGFPGLFAWRLSETTNAKGQPVIWVGTFSNCLLRFEAEAWTRFDKASGVFPHQYVRSLTETHWPGGPSTLWIGTDEGLVRFDGAGWKTFTTADGLPQNKVPAVFETTVLAGKPELLAVCDRSLVRFDGNRWQPVPGIPDLPQPAVSEVVETKAADGGAILWVGLQENGLVRLDRVTASNVSPPVFRWTSLTEKTGFPSDLVWCLQAENTPSGTRSLWVGTSAGLVRLAPHQWRSFDTRQGLPHNVVWGIRQAPTTSDSPGLWVGTTNGIACFSTPLTPTAAPSRIYQSAQGLPHNQVWCLLETSLLTGKPALVAGTTKGLARFENGRWIPFRIPTADTVQPLVWCLGEGAAADGSPALWAGGPGNGLWCWNQNQWKHFTQADTGFPSDWVYGILETVNAAGGRTLWFATLDGLVRMEQGRLRLLGAGSGLPSNSIWGLHRSQTPEGQQFLWIAGNRGAARAKLDDPTLAWTTFSTTSVPPLPDNDIYQITEDRQGRLYLSTNRGVARLTPRLPTAENPAPYQVLTFTTEDGLPANDCNQGALYVDPQGTVWVGTPKGLGRLNPAHEVTDTTNAPLMLEQAVAGHREAVALHPGAELSHNQNLVNFEFALLRYTHQTETRYRTQLIGVDEVPLEWTSDPKIRYTNLAAGTYTFQVWGQDYSGTITGPTTLSFHVKPAPWQTWWAYGMFSSLGIAAGYGAIRWRVRTLERRNLALETKVRERTTELAEKIVELDGKNQELDGKNRELDQKNEELARKNRELVESQKRALFIFSALADVLPGTVLDGKYQLDAKIGAGGFGAVFRAVHLGLNRPVAVKIFRPVTGEDSRKALERFRLEGVSACRVNHPNAVQVLDSGVSAEGIAYLVMELLDGHSLAAELLEKTSLSLLRCVRILQPLCAVLAEAHAAGIIHRDIKPDNVFLHQSGEGEVVKVVDFGIAKLLHEDSVAGQNLTATGGIVGTPNYMAPERLNNDPYDGQSDVYSVGVMLYQMLCGRLPFLSGTNNFYALVFQHINEPPPALHQFNPTIPGEIETLVLSSLAKNPADRPAIKELADRFTALIARHLNLSGTEDLLERLKKEPVAFGSSNIVTLLMPPQTDPAKAPESSGTERFGSGWAFPAENTDTVQYMPQLAEQPTLANPQTPLPRPPATPRSNPGEDPLRD